MSVPLPSTRIFSMGLKAFVAKKGLSAEMLKRQHFELTLHPYKCAYILYTLYNHRFIIVYVNYSPSYIFGTESLPCSYHWQKLTEFGQF